MTKSTTKHTTYENNPFTVAIQGLNLLFDKAKSVAILLLVLSILGFFGNFTRGSGDHTSSRPDFTIPNWTVGEWAMIGGAVLIVALAAIFIGSMLSGISAYTSARIARGHTVTLNEAFHAVLDRFFSYIWLQIIIVVKTLLWSLLLIVPGIIMSVRYSLANVAFFDKELNGNAAVQESLRLTKGSWLTTFASQVLFNIVTLGVISSLVTGGAKAVLYRQFSRSDAKPPAHVLSWITLALPFALLFLIIIMAIMFVAFVALIGGSQTF
jgi:hypothetical protein